MVRIPQGRKIRSSTVLSGLRIDLEERDRCLAGPARDFGGRPVIRSSQTSPRNFSFIEAGLGWIIVVNLGGGLRELYMAGAAGSIVSAALPPPSAPGSAPENPTGSPS